MYSRTSLTRSEPTLLVDYEVGPKPPYTAGRREVDVEGEVGLARDLEKLQELGAERAVPREVSFVDGVVRVVGARHAGLLGGGAGERGDCALLGGA